METGNLKSGGCYNLRDVWWNAFYSSLEALSRKLVREALPFSLAKENREVEALSWGREEENIK